MSTAERPTGMIQKGRGSQTLRQLPCNVRRRRLYNCGHLDSYFRQHRVRGLNTPAKCFFTFKSQAYSCQLLFPRIPRACYTGSAKPAKTLTTPWKPFIERSYNLTGNGKCPPLRTSLIVLSRTFVKAVSVHLGLASPSVSQQSVVVEN